MKTLGILITLALGMLNFSYAQDCSVFVPNKKGSEWEITNYNAKGKAEGSTKYKMVDINSSGSKTTFKIHMTAFDKKGKELMQNELEAFCDNGNFEFDMSFFFNEDMMGGMNEMDVDMEMEMSSLEMPNFSDPVGTTLEDGLVTVKMDMPGMGAMEMRFLYTDRKISNRESKTVPAGTFDCIVLDQTLKMKTILEMTINSKDWYADGIGMVRSETYRKGKLDSYSELTMMK